MRGEDGVEDAGVGLLGLFLLDRLLGLEAAPLAGDLAGEGGGVEFRDAADSRAAFDEALPGRLIADTERRDHPDPGDDDAAFVHVAVMDTGGGCIIPVLGAARAQWPV